MDLKKISKITILSLLLVFIVAYAFWRSKDLIFGVKIRDVNITDGQKIEESVVKITGNAKNAILLTLDDRPISIDQEGNFNETIYLFPGYNIVSIKAKDEFGNEDEKDYKLIR